MKHQSWLLLVVVLAAMCGGAVPAMPPLARASAGDALNRASFSNLPLYFEPNAGQADSAVRYIARTPGSTVFFTPSEMVLALQVDIPGGEKGIAERHGEQFASRDMTRHVSASYIPVRLRFEGRSQSPDLVAGERLSGRVSYFRGNDPLKWHAGLPTYRDITYTDLYPGIDLTYEGNAGRLKGTYTVAPGADPNLIRWRYEGVTGVDVDGRGNLQIQVTGEAADTAILTEEAPMAWQDKGEHRVPVSARYVVAEDGSVSFVLSSYDPAYTLTIDPTLAYSTYLGGNVWDGGYSIATDNAGNIYVAGSTGSTNFPTRDPYQPTVLGNSDIFVTKLDASGSGLVFSTYLGGSGSRDEGASAIALDTEGNVYLTGATSSKDFPLANPYQSTYTGVYKMPFVTKLNAAGTTLAYSTYLGGSGLFDESRDISVDQAGNAYVIGVTDASDFPVANAYQPTFGGDSDAFITKLNPTGSALIYSTYLGGARNDWSNSLAVDDSGNAYLTGFTTSADFPTSNAFQPVYAGGDGDAFITKLSAAGTALVFSTYLGGSCCGTSGGSDAAHGIAVDQSNNVYVFGHTGSSDFPLANPYQASKRLGSDTFVSKMDASGSALVYSTYLGGNDADFSAAIAVDGAGDAYVTGYTGSIDFPMSSPLQPNSGGSYDVYVTKFNGAGTALVYSTYLGGDQYDAGASIVVDQAGNAYLTGYTESTTFPTKNAYQPANGGGYDAFITRIYDPPAPTPTITLTPLPTTTPTSATPGSTATATAIATSTTCPVTFSDVPPDNAFYPYVRCLACRAVMSGYDDGTFRSNNNITRGQLSKIVSNSAGFGEPASGQMFEDVRPSNTFYPFVERMASRGMISGYPCGGPGEPCEEGDKPYFRPDGNATRAQISKIVSNAAGYDNTPTQQTFEDAPPTLPFYTWIERLASHGAMGGYPCGGTGEPCSVDNRPYFRPYNHATRGQVSKIVTNTFFPDCEP